MQEVHKRFRDWSNEHVIGARWPVSSYEVPCLQQEKLVQLLLAGKDPNHLGCPGEDANISEAISRGRVREEAH